MRVVSNASLLAFSVLIVGCLCPLLAIKHAQMPLLDLSNLD